MAKVEMAGQRFSRLVVLREAGKDKHGNFKWDCLCDCGTGITVVGYSLRQGMTRSCGCLAIENIEDLNKSHGLSGHPLFRTWLAMKRRCYNPRSHGYPDYGGRGITVCDEWRNDFAVFFKDMGEKPSPEYTLERKRVNENYCKDNCKWATLEEQANNKRNSRFIEAGGKTQTLQQWSRETGCHPTTILARIAIGMTEAEAVTTPVMTDNHRQLTADQVRQIRAMKATAGGQSAVGRLYGVSKTVITRIWDGSAYRDIPGADEVAAIPMSIPTRLVLTPDQVRAIRSRERVQSLSATCREFGLANSTIKRIWSRDLYKEVT